MPASPCSPAGAALTDARLVAILLHGRGASAEDILGLATDFGVTDVAYLAPQAAGNTWYPYSFLTPMEKNEPDLSSALGMIARLGRAPRASVASRPSAWP